MPELNKKDNILSKYKKFISEEDYDQISNEIEEQLLKEAEEKDEEFEGLKSKLDNLVIKLIQ